MKTNLEINDFKKMISNMKHCLGIDLNEIKKGQKTINCYRNYFCGNDKYLDMAHELRLVETSAENSSVFRYYFVNKKGMNFLSDILNKRVKYE